MQIPVNINELIYIPVNVLKWVNTCKNKCTQLGKYL